MLNVNKINNLSYNVSKRNTENQTSTQLISSSNSAKMPNIPASAYGLNFAGRGSVVVKLHSDVQRIFGNIRFVRNPAIDSAYSIGSMGADRAYKLLDKYRQAQSADFSRVVQSVKTVDTDGIDQFYTKLLEHLDKYPLRSGHVYRSDRLAFDEAKISDGYLYEPASPLRDMILELNPSLAEYFESTLPGKIIANGCLIPEDLVRVISYKGKNYQITPDLIVNGHNSGIILSSKELVK